MKISKVLVAVVATAALSAIAAMAFAQQGAMGGRFDNEASTGNSQGSGGGPSPQKSEEVRKKIEAIRIWRLTEELKLDEKTSARLASLLSSIDQRRAMIARESMEAMRDLRAYLKSEKPDRSKLKAALDRIERNQNEMMDLRKKEIGGVRDILTVEQQARYVLFQQKFRREMRGMISEARGRGQGMRGFGQGRMGGGPAMGTGPMPGAAEQPQGSR